MPGFLHTRPLERFRPSWWGLGVGGDVVPVEDLEHVVDAREELFGAGPVVVDTRDARGVRDSGGRCPDQHIEFAPGQPAGWEIVEADPVRFVEVGFDRLAARLDEGGEAGDSPKSIP